MSIGLAVVIVLAAIAVGAGIWAAVTFTVRQALHANGGSAAVAAPTQTRRGGAVAPAVAEAPDRRAELVRLEERLLTREETLEARAREMIEREKRVAEREIELDRLRDERIRALEGVAGMAASQAKAALLADLEDKLRHDSARLVRQIEQETKRDADRRVRNILSVVMQRMAAGHAAETTVSVVQLPSDDMKGRIIGRDGRIHPARIEETYYQAKSELEDHIVKAGEEAVFEANVGAMDHELIRLLGR
jgi:ribonuclease Y